MTNQNNFYGPETCVLLKLTFIYCFMVLFIAFFQFLGIFIHFIHFGKKSSIFLKNHPFSSPQSSVADDKSSAPKFQPGSSVKENSVSLLFQLGSLQEWFDL